MQINMITRRHNVGPRFGQYFIIVDDNPMEINIHRNNSYYAFYTAAVAHTGGGCIGVIILSILYRIEFDVQKLRHRFILIHDSRDKITSQQG